MARVLEHAKTQITVCVPTFKRPELLERCLWALQKQIATGFSYSVLVVDNDAAQSARPLVLRWRQAGVRIDYATEPMVMADLVLCAPVIAREAKELKKSLADHYAHLLVHGTLHAQGWDHETGEADAEAMEARETGILAGLGVADPYGRG